MDQPPIVACASPIEQRKTLSELIASDVAHYARQAQAFQGDRPGLSRRISILFTASLICCTLHRIAHALHARSHRGLARAFARLNLLLNRTLIDPAAQIGPGLYIPHPPGVVFRGSAGRNLRLFTMSLVGPLHTPYFCDALDACPRLGDDVTLGANAIVAGAIEVGSRVQVAPGATLLRSVGSDLSVIAPYLHARSAREAAPQRS